MQRIISFDIGVKNLAVCLLEKPIESENPSIIYWDVIVLSEEKKPNLDSIAESLFTKLDDLIEKYGLPDIVLIENQPALRNPTMKSVQICVYSYYMLAKHRNDTQKPEVMFISATEKLKVVLPKKPTENGSTEVVAEAVKPKTKMSYAVRKKQSIQMALQLLETLGDVESLEKMKSHKKKDDMADSLLQAIAWIQKKKPKVHLKENK